MTINQAHNYIKLELDKTSSLELPSFESEEIDYWLDDSILKIIKQKYSGGNVKGESFEQSQKRMDDLRTLISEGSILTSSGSGTYDNSEVFDLTTLYPDYFLSVKEEAIITYSGATSRVRVISISHDRVTIKLEDPFSEHNISFSKAKPLRLMVGNTIVLIGDGNYTIDGMYISYLRVPTKMVGIIDRDAEYEDLTDSVMSEVVKIASNSMLENIESQRYQTHSIETSLVE